jgi:hypothetical protein
VERAGLREEDEGGGGLLIKTNPADLLMPNELMAGKI